MCTPSSPIHEPSSSHSTLEPDGRPCLVSAAGESEKVEAEAKTCDVTLNRLSGTAVSVRVQIDDQGAFTVGTLRHAIKQQFCMDSVESAGLLMGSDKLDDNTATLRPGGLEYAQEPHKQLLLIRGPDVQQRYQLLVEELNETVAEALTDAEASAKAIPDARERFRESQRAFYQMREAFQAFVASDAEKPGHESLQLENEACYVGQRSAGRNHGVGLQVWPDGTGYSGNWVEGLAEGYGWLVLANGKEYNGMWVRDRAQGYGVYSHADGTTYTGELLEDKQHGFGLEVFGDGARYEGAYKSGQKDGLGCFSWPCGSSYKGNIAGNLFSGPGKYRLADGRVYAGHWWQHQMNGQGHLTFSNGRVYKGGHVADKKQGLGSFSWPDGRCYIGQWQGGKQHGRGFYRKCDGVVTEGEWADGVRTSWTSKPFKLSN